MVTIEETWNDVNHFLDWLQLADVANKTNICPEDGDDEETDFGVLSSTINAHSKNIYHILYDLSWKIEVIREQLNKICSHLTTPPTP
jgi:hypothetical protein